VPQLSSEEKHHAALEACHCDWPYERRGIFWAWRLGALKYIAVLERLQRRLQSSMGSTV
jgi:hypothetical protein